ncbi:MAG: helix-turn-helix transcriptional regulator [Chitinophagales bacterium]
MPVQLNIFLLLFGGLQGLLLSLFLARKKTYRNGYIFLIIYILVMLLQITLKVVSKIWLMENMRTIYSLSYRLPFLYGPLVYLFVVYLLMPNRRFGLKDLLHFAPFVIAILAMLTYTQVNLGSFLTGAFFNPAKNLSLQVATIGIYHILAYRQWLSSGRPAKDVFSDLSKLQFKWLKSFIILSAIVSLVIALAVFFMYIYYPHWNHARFLFVALTVFIYWISYTALSQPSVFTVINGQFKTDSPPFVPKLVVHRRTKKYSNSGLTTEDISVIRLALQKLMTEKKPYLNPEITINDLAALVKCNRHHLSQVLNESFHRSFYDYVNQYRVEEAKQLLLDPVREDHKIASIAYDSGFNSLSTFNDVFKKMTGGTPSQFKKVTLISSRQQHG